MTTFRVMVTTAAIVIAFSVIDTTQSALPVPGRQPIYSRNGLLSRCRPVGSATDYMPLPILLERL